MGRCKIPLGYLEREGPGSALSRSTESNTPPIGRVLIVTGTGRRLVIEILRHLSQVLTMSTTRITPTNTVLEGVQETLLLQVLDTIIPLPHTTLLQDRSLTS